MLSIHSIAAEAAACHRAISKIKNIKEDLAFLLGLPFCIIPESSYSYLHRATCQMAQMVISESNMENGQERPFGVSHIR